MINKISISNFKCLKNNNLDCKKLNILTGLNGMGKSTLIQLLLVLRQSYKKGAFSNGEIYLSLGDSYNPNDLIQLGTYEDAIYRLFKSDEEYISIKVEFSESEALFRTQSYNEANTDSANIKLIPTNFDNSIFEEALFTKQKFQFIQAERLGPRNNLPKDDDKVNEKNFGIDGKFAMHYFLNNLKKPLIIEKLKHESETENKLGIQLDAWLNEISPGIRVKSEFDKDDKTKINSLYDIKTSELNLKPFKAKNIGFGVSYIFSVVLAILTAEPDDLIIIENPEAHLHPQGQSKLAQLMAIAAQNGVQIFVETHSDHIINGTLVACKKGLINNENISIQYFDRKENELYSENYEVKVLEKGRIKYAPIGFFDQIAKDLRFLMSAQK